MERWEGRGTGHLCHCMHLSQPHYGDKDLPALQGPAATGMARERPAAPAVPKEGPQWWERLLGGAVTSLALSPCQTSHSRSSLSLLPLLQMAGALSPCPSFVTPPALSLHSLGALESPLCQGGGRGKGFPPHLPPLLSGGSVRRDVHCPTATYIQREREEEEDQDPFTPGTALGLTPSSHLRPAPSS